MPTRGVSILYTVHADGYSHIHQTANGNDDMADFCAFSDDSSDDENVAYLIATSMRPDGSTALAISTQGSTRSARRGNAQPYHSIAVKRLEEDSLNTSHK